MRIDDKNISGSLPAPKDARFWVLDSLAELKEIAWETKSLAIEENPDREFVHLIEMQGRRSGGAVLTAVSKDSALAQRKRLSKYQLESYLEKYPEDLFLLMEIKSSKHFPVNTEISLLASSSCLQPQKYAYLRSFSRQAPVRKIVEAFWASARLPEHVTSALRLGEVIHQEFTGLLRVPSAICSENRSKDCVEEIFGNFSMTVLEHDKPGWARIIVRKNREIRSVVKLRPSVTGKGAGQKKIEKASQNECLIEVSVNLMLAEGKKMMHDIGQLDFTSALVPISSHMVHVDHCSFLC